MEQPTYEQLSGALLSVGLASAFGESERSAKLKTLQALRDKKYTWCGHAEITLRADIDSTLTDACGGKREAVAKAKAAGLTDADLLAMGLRANAEVSGAGTASAGLPG